MYRRPARLVRAHAGGLALSLGLLAAGAGMQMAAMERGDATLQAVAFLTVVVAGMGLAVAAVLHFIAAREVRFTRESLVVRQPFHRDATLPYSTYEVDWMVDVTPAGNARVIVFEPHRACTVLMPPEWFRTALAEVARIQEEEGWYEPREDGSAKVAEPLAESQS